MPTFSMTKNWSNGSVLTESMLDDIKNSTETFLNSTKVDSSNIQNGGVATVNYANASVDTAALAASAVTTAKLADGVVTTDKVGDGAVTTAKLGDGAVTNVKRSALGQQISSSSGSFSTTSTTATDVTNLSVSITTTGRPVWVGLISDASGSSSRIFTTGTAGQSISFFKIVRGSNEICRYTLWDNDPSGSPALTVPSSCLYTIDVPAAGTYTYKMQAFSSTSTYTTGVENAKLLVYEL